MSEPNSEQLAEWETWLAERPPRVAEVARRLPPWKLLRLRSTGQHAQVQRYDEHEDGSVTISASCWHDWNPLALNVFGIDPNDLEVDLGIH